MKRFFVCLTMMFLAIITCIGQKLLYQGIYDSRSFDGMAVTFEITIYEDRMEFVNVTGGVRSATTTCPFSTIRNGERVYCSVIGSGQWRIEVNYFVNDNYDIRELNNGREIVKYVKKGQSFGSANSGNASGYSNGNTSGYNSSNSSSGSTSTIPRTKCPNCTNGRRVYEGTVGYSEQIRYTTCSECGKRYMSSHTTHRHDRCTTCHGSGYLD